MTSSAGHGPNSVGGAHGTSTAVATDVEVAIAAAVAGAAEVAEGYGGAVPQHDKGGGDFATDADLASEAAILGVIRAARPDDAVLGEETGAHGSDATRLWLVDPLCGTLNFAAQTPLGCVNVALTTGGTMVAAAVADPVSGEVFWSDGDGAWLRHGTTTTDRPLRPSGASNLVDVNLDGPFPSAPAFDPRRLVTDPAFAARFRPRVLSTTLAVAWVAAGRRAGYVSDRPMWRDVHFGAGIALCEAAGCVVTDLAGAPLGPHSLGLVVGADATTHRDLMRLVRD